MDVKRFGVLHHESILISIDSASGNEVRAHHFVKSLRTDPVSAWASDYDAELPDEMDMREPMKWELERALEKLNAKEWVGREVGDKEALPLTTHDLAVVVPALRKALEEIDANEARAEKSEEDPKSAPKRGRPKAVDAATGAERQAEHKKRMRNAGLTETKVRVRQGQENVMRAVAAALISGALTEGQLWALLEPKPTRETRAKMREDEDLTAPDPRQVTLDEAIEAAKARREQGEG